jgi:thiamine-phosphate pyrophosphorylase
MDQRLIAWARAVKARWHPLLLPQGEGPFVLPPLWLFTDARRLADPRQAAARLPRGLAGIVLRHDNEPTRAALGRALAGICRARRLALVVAGDARLAAALGAGVHLRGGRWPGLVRPRRRLVTSSAHSVPELRRAARTGARLVFLGPAFATASHPGVAALGPVRWAALARRTRLPVLALGGIAGDSAQRLPRHLCRGAGAIGALG